ncbi:hypothetical protein [Sphingorhabdus sp.]|jgi:hypothetical protein
MKTLLATEAAEAPFLIEASIATNKRALLDLGRRQLAIQVRSGLFWLLIR